MNQIILLVENRCVSCRLDYYKKDQEDQWEHEFVAAQDFGLGCTIWIIEGGLPCLRDCQLFSVV